MLGQMCTRLKPDFGYKQETVDHKQETVDHLEAIELETNRNIVRASLFRYKHMAWFEFELGHIIAVPQNSEPCLHVVDGCQLYVTEVCVGSITLFGNTHSLS
jgi:hypothetical protein